MTTAPAAAAAWTDIEAAHRGHALAVDAVRGLEARLETAFRNLHDARQELIERAGVSAVVDFTEPMGAAWEIWLATHEARRMAADPDAAQEAEALEIANRAARAGAAE